MNLDFKYYFAIFLRRVHYFVLIAAIISAAALAAAYLMPPVYKAGTTLLWESSQIPGPLAPPSPQSAAMEKLQTTEKYLMTRSNLLDIANRLRVFKDLEKMRPDDIVKAMVDSTTIKKSAGLNQATLMNIEFNGESAETTAGVVNEYVTLILRDNVASRTERAGQTLEFFQQQVKTLSGDMDEQSQKILAFQNANKDKLPNTLQFRMNQQAGLQSQIAGIQQNIAGLKDQKDRLVAVFNATGQVNNATGPQMTPAEQKLAGARDQLSAALATMSATNPKVKLLQAQVTQLQDAVRAQTPMPTPAPDQTNPAKAMLDVQLAGIDSQVKTLTQQHDALAKQLATLTDSINQTADIQVALDALNRDYQNIQGQYNAATQKLASAATTEQIELLSKGERITVVDAATVPDRPFKPNRLLIGGGGILGGMGLGLGAIVLLELLNRSVRRPKDLVKSFGITPISTIPYLRTPAETVVRRSGFAVMLLAAVVGIPAMIYAVHMYYQPLDLIFAKVAAKFGINL